MRDAIALLLIRSAWRLTSCNWAGDYLEAAERVQRWWIRHRP